MPTYEFRCPDGSIIERVFKMSEVPESIPAPGGGTAVRIISGGADLIFKGSGFYITDYGKDGKKDERAAKEKSGSGKESAGESRAGGEKQKTESSSSDASTKSTDTKSEKSDKASSSSKPDKSPPPSGAAA